MPRASHSHTGLTLADYVRRASPLGWPARAIIQQACRDALTPSRYLGNGNRAARRAHAALVVIRRESAA